MLCFRQRHPLTKQLKPTHTPNTSMLLDNHDLTSSLLSFFKILTPYVLKHPNVFHFRQVPMDKKSHYTRNAKSFFVSSCFNAMYEGAEVE